MYQQPDPNDPVDVEEALLKLRSQITSLERLYELLTEGRGICEELKSTEQDSQLISAPNVVGIVGSVSAAVRRGINDVGRGIAERRVELPRLEALAALARKGTQ